jgi:hypothetical protein
LAFSIAVNFVLCFLFASEIKKIGRSLLYKQEAIHAPLVTTRVYELNSEKTEELYWRGDTSNALPLPDSLFIQTGSYNLNAHAYLFKDEGLYRVFRFFGENDQRIVFNGDVQRLLSSVCWVISHGDRDDTACFDTRIRKAMSGKLYLTCGPAVSFAIDVFTQFNIPCRKVNTYSLNNVNRYDDGHVMMEVYDGVLQKWILVDIDNNCLFVKDGKILSLMEAWTAYQNNDVPKLNILSSDALVDMSGCKVPIGEQKDYDFGMYTEQIFARNNKHNWYKEMFAAVSINGLCFEKSHHNLLLRFNGSLQFVTIDEFMSRNYGFNTKQLPAPYPEGLN